MTEDALDRAFRAHRAGDAAAAALGYEEALRADGGNQIALTLLSLIRMQSVISRTSMQAALANLRAQGFAPRTVIDVGAQIGTPPLFVVFPESHHVMLEPVAECHGALAQICATLKSAEHHVAAVAERSGQVTMLVSPNRQNSGIVTGPVEHPGEYRTIQSISLNDLCAQRNLPQPYLIKIDVDGLEIEVLKGGGALTSPDSVFVIEATVNDGHPRLPRIMEFFRPYDFVLHDIVDPMYRPADGALWQVDVVMVHKDSPYRRKKDFY